MGNTSVIPIRNIKFQKPGGWNYDFKLIPKKEAQVINYKMYEEFKPAVLDRVFLPFNYERV